MDESFDLIYQNSPEDIKSLISRSAGILVTLLFLDLLSIIPTIQDITPSIHSLAYLCHYFHSSRLNGIRQKLNHKTGSLTFLFIKFDQWSWQVATSLQQNILFPLLINSSNFSYSTKAFHFSRSLYSFKGKYSMLQKYFIEKYFLLYSILDD